MISRVELETFCYESEDPKKVKEALYNVANGLVTSETVVSNLGTKIIKMRMMLAKRRDISSFMDKIRPLDINPVQHMEGSVVHLRLSKQEAYVGNTKLGTRDVIKVEVHFQTYPSRKAKEEAKKLFEGV